MDGTMTRNLRQVMAKELRRMKPGTLVELKDEIYGTVTKYVIVRQGNSKRLSRCGRSDIGIEIADIWRHSFYVEE